LNVVVFTFRCHIYFRQSPWTIYFSYFASLVIAQFWALRAVVFFPAISVIPPGFWTPGINEAAGDMRVCFLSCFCDATAVVKSENVGLFPTAFGIISLSVMVYLFAFRPGWAIISCCIIS
jgi:hypothetical protein